MVLLLCSVILNVYIVRAGYVDITIKSENFTGFLNFTYDAYIGFFFYFLPDEPMSYCKLSYTFSVNRRDVSSATCTDLNITDYGDFFECGAMKQTNFECNRVKRGSVCENDKQWVVFYINPTNLAKSCVGICLSSSNERITISYQETFLKDAKSICLKPNNVDTTTAQNIASSSGISGITFITSPTLTTKSPVGEPCLTSSSQTPEIVGLIVSNAFLVLVILCILIFCLRKRIPYLHTHRNELKSINMSEGYDNPDEYPEIIPQGNSTEQSIPTKNCTNKKSGNKINMKVKNYHERNEAEMAFETKFSRKMKKNGKEIQVATQQCDAGTSEKSENSSNNYVNKTVLDLTRDGISLNVAGNVYDQLTIKSCDSDTVEGDYLYAKHLDNEMARMSELKYSNVVFNTQ